MRTHMVCEVSHFTSIDHRVLGSKAAFARVSSIADGAVPVSRQPPVGGPATADSVSPRGQWDRERDGRCWGNGAEGVFPGLCAHA